MARRRSENSESSDTVKQDRRRLPKLVITVNEDGRPDVGALSTDARDRLREALEESAPPPPEPVNPAVVAFALNAIARIEAALLAGRFDLTVDTAMQCLTPAEPLASSMAAAGARVLDKHSGAWLRYQDEIALAALFASWQAGALQALRTARDARKAADRQPSARGDTAPKTARPEHDYPVAAEAAEAM